jgi:hypothetical protein
MTLQADYCPVTLSYLGIVIFKGLRTLAPACVSSFWRSQGLVRAPQKSHKSASRQRSPQESHG